MRSSRESEVDVVADKVSASLMGAVTSCAITSEVIRHSINTGKNLIYLLKNNIIVFR